MKELKTREERVKEGVSLLSQLRNAGVKEHTFGFIELKTRISSWVNTNESWDGIIQFSEYGRIADISLPKYNNRSATLNFKIRRRV